MEPTQPNDGTIEQGGEWEYCQTSARLARDALLPPMILTLIGHCDTDMAEKIREWVREKAPDLANPLPCKTAFPEGCGWELVTTFFAGERQYWQWKRSREGLGRDIRAEANRMIAHGFSLFKEALEKERGRVAEEGRTGYSGRCACGAEVPHDGDYATCDACDKAKGELAER